MSRVLGSDLGADWDAAGWCQAARRCPSPNFDARPDGCAITLLVIHNISLPAGQFGGPHIANLFTNQLDLAAHPDFQSLQGVRVSAHFLILRDGSLVQFVAAGQRAWHAGVSEFEGRSRCNDFSIGVELEGCDSLPFEMPQYSTLVNLTLCLQRRYPMEAVCGHQDIAPGRKTDPGPHFDWAGFATALHSRSQSQSTAHQHLPFLRFPQSV